VTHDQAVARAEELTREKGQTYVARRRADRPDRWRVENREKQRARDRVENLSPERLARKRAKDRAKVMSRGQLDKKRARELRRNNGHTRLDRAGNPMTPEAWDDYLQEFGNRCFVCARADVKLVVDHCHDTGYTRAPLCDACNQIEGALKKIGTLTLRQLTIWAIRMATLRELPWVSMTPAELKAAKKRGAA
jgi:hypothetical protein